MRFKNQIPPGEFRIPQVVQDISSHLDESVYDSLPECLTGILSVARNRQEKDALLLGALTVISGCLPNVGGWYDGRFVHPNLYTFIDAPAGAGKGILNFLRIIGDGIHQEKLRSSIGGKTSKSPIEQKMLFIPANNSASAFLNTLHDNNQSGILFATEADTLTNSLSQDWGNFSDILRCSFHHETIEMQRRSNREYLTVAEPKLSVLLSGTPDQLLSLIPNPENGLFSRFLFYSMSSIPHFRNVFESNEKDSREPFFHLRDQIDKLYHELLSSKQIISCKLTGEMESHFVQFYQNLTVRLHKEVGDHILASIQRSGVISYRILTILTVLRVAIDQNQVVNGPLFSSIRDMERSLQLSIHSVRASIFHISKMPMSNQNVQGQQLGKFYSVLPERFTKQQAILSGASINISPATISRYLSSALFTRIKHGHYAKTEVIERRN